MSAPEKGWWKHPLSRANAAWHYYDEDGKSLCGKYVKLGGQFPEDADDPRCDEIGGNCKACRQKIVKLRHQAEGGES